jgi:hypothetical protein
MCMFDAYLHDACVGMCVDVLCLHVHAYACAHVNAYVHVYVYVCMYI